MREWNEGWGLCAHLWNILWALSVAHGGDGGGASPETAAEDEEEAAAKRARTEETHDGEAQPPAAAASDAPADGGFDYAAYALARWHRYLAEKAAETPQPVGGPAGHALAFARSSMYGVAAPFANQDDAQYWLPSGSSEDESDSDEEGGEEYDESDDDGDDDEEEERRVLRPRSSKARSRPAIITK